MDLGDGYGHLGYSTLVHPGDTWEDMRDSLRTFVPQVKERFCPNDPLAVSLRLSNASVERLVADPAEVAALASFLRDQDLYIFTINAFPYGSFKGTTVKERVYEPDWTTLDRVRYTTDIARLLVEITREDIEPSIQTAPLAFQPKVVNEAYVSAFTENILQVVGFLMNLESETGKRVKLALEPEPACYLETIPGTIDYFSTHIFTASAARRVADHSGQPLSNAYQGIRRHLGVVLDIGHQSVQFEDIAEDLAMLDDAGIPVFKLQPAAALDIPVVDDAVISDLERFTGTIYLSQTTQKRDGELTRFLNLEDAILEYRSDPGPRWWRTHFHVPVFLDDLGPFKTTRAGIDAALAVHATRPVSDHVEIETYTWDVLPDHLKTGDIVDYVVRELEYVRDQFLSARSSIGTGT